MPPPYRSTPVQYGAVSFKLTCWPCGQLKPELDQVAVALLLVKVAFESLNGLPLTCSVPSDLIAAGIALSSVRASIPLTTVNMVMA